MPLLQALWKADSACFDQEHTKARPVVWTMGRDIFLEILETKGEILLIFQGKKENMELGGF